MAASIPAPQLAPMAPPLNALFFPPIPIKPKTSPVPGITSIFAQFPHQLINKNQKRKHKKRKHKKRKKRKKIKKRPVPLPNAAPLPKPAPLTPKAPMAPIPNAAAHPLPLLLPPLPPLPRKAPLPAPLPFGIAPFPPPRMPAPIPKAMAPLPNAAPVPNATPKAPMAPMLQRAPLPNAAPLPFGIAPLPQLLPPLPPLPRKAPLPQPPFPFGAPLPPPMPAPLPNAAPPPIPFAPLPFAAPLPPKAPMLLMAPLPNAAPLPFAHLPRKAPLPPPLPFGIAPLPPMPAPLPKAMVPPPVPSFPSGYCDSVIAKTDDDSFLLFDDNDEDDEEDEKMFAPKSSNYAVNYSHVHTKITELTEEISVTDEHCGEKLLEIFDKIKITNEDLSMWVRWSGGSFPNKESARASLKTVIDYAEKSPSSPLIKKQLRVITKLIIEKGIDKSEEYVHFMLLLATHGKVCNVMKDIAINNAYGMMTESLMDIIKLQSLENILLRELRNYRHILVEKLHLQFKFHTNQHTVNGFYNEMAPFLGLIKYIDNHLGNPGGRNAKHYKKNLDKRFFATLYNKENIIKRIYLLINEKKIGYQKIVKCLEDYCPKHLNKMDFLQAAINIDDGTINEDYLCWLLTKLNIFARKGKEWKKIVKCWENII